MSTEKYVSGSGQGLTWGDAFSTATLNGVPNADSILSDISITNGTALDIWADVSIHLASLAVSGNCLLSLAIYPLNKDGSTYGDGRFATAAGGQPAGNYWVANLNLVAATQAQDVIAKEIILPPGTFKFVLFNASGTTLAATGNTCQYRTYNRSVA